MRNLVDFLFVVAMGLILAACTGVGFLVVFEASSLSETVIGVYLAGIGSLGTVMATVSASEIGGSR